MRKFRKLRSTQRPNHDYADGHVPRSPTGHNPHAPGGEPRLARTSEPSAAVKPHLGPRVDRTAVTGSNLRLTNITNERARTNAHPLAKRFTKFITNVTGQVKIPKDLLSKDRGSSGEDEFGQRCVHVGQIPED